MLAHVIRSCSSLLLVASGLQLLAAEPEWGSIAVPGAWETQSIDGAEDYDGYAWYRTWLKPHNSYFAGHERNLFAESVTITMRQVADAHAVFVNGKEIGTGGEMPPSYASGIEGNHRHKVPPGLLVKGAWNEIAIKVYNKSGPGGFLKEAPFIMDYFNECVLEGKWEFVLGEKVTLGAALKERPSSTAFDQYHESNRVLGRAVKSVPGPSESPLDSYDMMEAGDGLIVDLLLHEPEVAQPVHVSFDARGRMWVSQYRQYPYPAGVEPISRDKYYRTHYSAVPPAPPNHAKGRDIISIHEDTDADGVYDKHSTFLTGLNMANAALRGRGGVWVMHTPYLLFYADTDFDDVPDVDPIVHLEGFGLEDSHSIANGLAWGPDGWLYGAQGSTTSSRVIRPGLDGPDAPGVVFEGCMVWRYHPETREFEHFATGSGNIFGLEFDAQGRLFSGHNGGGTRGWHYVQGGYYLKQGVNPGKFGPPRNPYTFGQLPMLGTQTSAVRFTHGLTVLEGTALPQSYQGHFLALDPLHNIGIFAKRFQVGTTFETADSGYLLRSKDSAFRPVFAVNAPDGSVVVADFYEHYIAHGQHYQSQIDPDSGRVYRVMGKDAELETNIHLVDSSADTLIGYLSHPNKWHRQTAVRLLGERKPSGVRATLEEMIRTGEGQASLEALWAYHQAYGLNDTLAADALKSSEAQVRLWTVRLLGDERKVSSVIGELLVGMARQDSDVEVRGQLAATARRLPASLAMRMVKGLVTHDQDLKDRYQSLMIWWVLESHIELGRETVLALFDQPDLWKEQLFADTIVPRIMKRFALSGKREDLLVCARLLKAAPAAADRDRLLAGFKEAYRGRSMVALPEELLAVMDASAMIIRVRSGDAEATKEAIELVVDSKAEVSSRLLFIQAFGELRIQEALPSLLNLVEKESDASVRKAVFRALASFDDDRIALKAIQLLPKLSNSLRPSALTLLISRTAWRAELLRAVDSGEVNRDFISAEARDQLVLSTDTEVKRLAVKVFPPSSDTGAIALRAKQEALHKVLKGGTGNPYAGESIYLNRCGTCHKLFFKGGQIGPDLTLYQRKDMGTLLLSVVNPNAEVREGYESVLVETKDGRTLSGFLTEKDTQVVVLRGLDGQDVVMSRDSIKEILPMGRSLMPEGLLEGLDEQSLRDLFAYLRISQPITR